MKGDNKWGWLHRSNGLAAVRSTWWALHHTSKIVHRLLVMGTGLLLVIGCLLAGTAWRLAQGPISLGRLSERIQTALTDSAGPLHISFNGVVLAWEGFHKGVDYPLDLRLSAIVITDQEGRHVAEAPAAHLTFSLAALLLGRVVPRAIEVDHAQAVVIRDADGAINLGWEQGAGTSASSGSTDLRHLREQLSHPVGSDHNQSLELLDQIQRVHFRDAELTFRDQESGLVVRTAGTGLDLVRAKGGRIRGLLRAPISISDQTAELVAEADWASGSNIKLDMALTALRPAGFGQLPPAIAPMAALDVAVSSRATVTFDTNLLPTQMQAQIQLGQGQIHVGQGGIPLRHGNIVLAATSDKLRLTTGHFDVAPTQDGAPQIIDVDGTIERRSNRLTASGSLALSQINIADLPSLWPSSIAAGARSWIIENVTGGTITRGWGSFGVEYDDALHKVALTGATGDVDVVAGTFSWIDNMPAVEQASVHLHLLDPDVLDIHVASGHQRIRNSASDLVVNGQMRIAGLSVRDQTAVIRTQVEGQIETALMLLKEPRLHLLSEHPIALKVGGGDASATLSFQFPLDSKLQIDDVQLHVDAHLKRVRLLDVAGGHELSDGVFDLGIDKDGLQLKGIGALAAIPVTLEGSMDFKVGRPDQIVQKITVTGQPDAAQLDAAGLPVADVVKGPIAMTAVVTERRSGDGSVALNGDLTQAALSIAPLAWNKLSGNAASTSATLLMSHGRLTKIDKIAVHGDGWLLNGSATFGDGHLQSVLLDTIRLGRTHGHGTVHLGGSDPITVVLQGDQVDLAPKLTEKTVAHARPDVFQQTAPAWRLNARFDHAFLANDVRAHNVLMKATGAGGQIRLLDAVGATSDNAGFSIKVEPRANKRHLLVDAKDAGSFLRGVDAIRSMQSGRLTIDGIFDQPSGLYPLEGSAVIENAVVKNSPTFGKLLQAITVYGLVDALRGPGMEFSRIVVPFAYDSNSLDLDQAYAENSSLGLTAKGRIDLSGSQTSLTGTIVPAYFFNSMLGQLPLVGKFFSPEKGGGIFAVRFGVTGDIADPAISINPISALTPGFLREIFSVFDSNPADQRGKAGSPSHSQ